ncbi:MAG TPA: SufD family Fe-S cluster assembly protein [Erysipelothrix sp.]|nr:SufD family Fe-S cluster assembly protein [Erysipelothrix sp.]
MENLFISHSQEIKLSGQGQLNQTISIEDRSSGNLVVYLECQGTMKLEIKLGQSAQWHILFIHSTSHELTIDETIYAGQDSHLNLGYGEFSKGHLVRNTAIKLDQGAYVETHGAVLVSGHLNWTLESHHLGKNTFAALNTNLVIGNAGKCRMEVVGSIPKGNSQSKTHQMTKILNLGQDSSAAVYPKLLIDENDVEASHAASVGQPEEEHIYYLMSRGLSRTQAMQLLIKGYLHPLVSLIENEAVKNQLFEIIDQEVGLYV